MANKNQLELKLKDGNFELWASGERRAFVMVASGETGQPHRVAVEVFSAAGMQATRSAHRVYNNLVLAYTQAVR